MGLDAENGRTKYGNRISFMSKKLSRRPDATLCLQKDDVLRQAYYKYVREDVHNPESYRVLKVLYERHIEGKHVPFNVMSSPRRT